MKDMSAIEELSRVIEHAEARLEELTPDQKEALELLVLSRSVRAYETAVHQVKIWNRITTKGDDYLNHLWNDEQFYGPLFVASFEQFLTEQTFQIERIKVIAQRLDPKNQQSVEDSAVATTKPEELYPTAREKRNAVRIYHLGIMEAWSKLDPIWQLGKVAANRTLNLSMRSVTIGVTLPGEFYILALDDLNQAILKSSQSKNRVRVDNLRKIASTGANARWGNRSEINKIIEKLAKQRDAIGDFIPADELWSHFYSALEEIELDPEDLGDRILWEGNGKGMMFATFRNRIGACRK